MGIPSSILILLASVAFAVLVRILARSTKTDLDDRIVSAIQNPLFWLIIIVGSSFALTTAFPDYEGQIITVAKVLSVLVVGRAVKNVVSDALFGRSIEFFDGETQKRLRSIKGMLDVVIYVAFVLVTLSAVGIDILPILAPLGIGGVALGFAVKDVATNYVAGVILAVDRDFTVGRRVTIKEKGITGVIESVGWRNTQILTDDGRRASIPNSAILNAVVIEEEAYSLSSAKGIP